MPSTTQRTVFYLLKNLLVHRFREAVQRESGVAAIAMADEKPGKEIRWPSTFATVDAQHPIEVPIKTTEMDESYIPGMGLTPLAGRNSHSNTRPTSLTPSPGPSVGS